jgi:cysteine desulfurase
MVDVRPEPWRIQGIYLDACATSPLAEEVAREMAEAMASGWANPSSLHGFGIAAADHLERSRCRVARCLAADPDEVVFVSGGSEAIHAALLGSAAVLEPGRLVISDVEHPATMAAAEWMVRLGWQVAMLPVDHHGVVRLDVLEGLLAPPTRLMSLIWGQSEVGAFQPIEAIGLRCRAAGVRLHVDAVQVVGHRRVDFSSLPVDLLSCSAHKLEGPRGIGALLVRSGLPLIPLIGGGGQERGRRGGTEPVALAVGFAAALERAEERLVAHAGQDPVTRWRDHLLPGLLELQGVRLSGPPPDHPLGRLPHHLSVLVSSSGGRPLSGRGLVRALWREGFAVSSGSACASGKGPSRGQEEPSPILLAMGFGQHEAGSGVRMSFGPWLREGDLSAFPAALARARRELERHG